MNGTLGLSNVILACLAWVSFGTGILAHADTTVTAAEHWTQATAQAGWCGRTGQATAVFDNKLWVLGGRYTAETPLYLNDVWCSSDGSNWTQATGGAEWSPRSGHSAVVFDNKLWIVAGGSGASEVWHSSDGAHWTLATDNAGWYSGDSFTTVVFDNKLWVLGSYHDYSYVWASSDGANWFQVTSSAPWEPRYGHTAATFQNKIWILGGRRAVGGSSQYLNDVWYSSDGATWTQATANAGWRARGWHTTAVCANKLWVFGGGYHGTSNPYLNDVWCSRDGVVWTQVTQQAEWQARTWRETTLTACVFKNKLWMCGGYYLDTSDASEHFLNDVWYAPVYHSSDCNPPDYRVSLSELLRLIQFYNSDGYHLDASMPDGYAPGWGSHAGVPHDSDFNGQDWMIGLPELLRLIQFYNSAGYHLQAGTADGFAPGP